MPSSFLTALRERLPAEAFPWVAAALLHDPLLWQALRGPLGQRALETLDATPASWHLAALARLALEEEAPPADDAPPATFVAAAHAAQRFNHRYAAAGDWRALQPLAAAPEGLLPWRTTLACLLGWQGDPRPLLQTLAALPQGPETGLHAILCQPIPPAAHTRLLLAFLQALPVEKRAPIVRLLHQQRPDLAVALAPRLPVAGPPPYTAWLRGWQQALGRGAEADEALATWRQARQEAAHLQRALAADHAAWAEAQGQTPQALAAWETAAPDAQRAPLETAHRALALRRHGQADKAWALLPEKPTHPALLAAYAVLAQEDAPQQAIRSGQEALTAAESLPPDLLRALAETLTALGHHALALEAARRLLHARPADPTAADLLARLALQTDHFPDALDAALLAAHLHPTPERQRRLAAAQEAMGLFDQAAATRRGLAAHAQASVDDRLAWAHAALQAGHLDEAEQALRPLLAQTPPSPAAQALHARLLAAQGQTQQARQALQQALHHHPDATALHLALTDLLAQEEGPDAAIAYLEGATQRLPENPALLAELGLRLLAAQRPAHARRPLETAHRQQPENIRVACALAETYLTLGETQQALTLLRPLTARKPTARCHRLLAQALLNQRQAPEAAAALRPLILAGEEASPDDRLTYARALLQARQDLPAAEQALKQALAQLSDETSPARQADFLLTLAEVQLAQGRAEEALQTYRQAMKTLPADAHQRQQRLLRGLAETALQAQRAETALAALEEALTHDPADPALHRLQAEAYARLGFDEQALAAAQRALRLAERAPQTVLWYARLMTQLNEEQRAKAVLQEAIAQNPADPALALALAEVYQRDEQRAEALRVLQRWLHAQGLKAETCARMGTLLLELDYPAEAAICLRRAVQAPHAPTAWYLTLAQALSAQQAYAEAAEVVQQALARPLPQPLTPEETNARVALHLLLVHNAMARGDHRAAADTLEDALHAYPHHPEVLREAVTLWRALGRLERALDAAEEYLKHQPYDLKMRGWAAQIARSLLQSERARAVLQPSHLIADEYIVAQPRGAAEMMAAAAEVMLDLGQEDAAAEAVQTGLQHHPGSGHLLALQARLLARQGAFGQARQHLDRAVEQQEPTPAGKPPTPETIATWAAIAKAAADLGLWETAYAFTERIRQRCPYNPGAALLQALLAVRTAEAAWRCRQVEARQQAPRDERVQKAENLWASALRSAANALQIPWGDEGPLAQHHLQKWYARGEAAFHDHVLPLLTNPEATPADQAAAWAAAQRGNAKADALPMPAHPLPHLHRALYLEAQAQTDETAGQNALSSAEAARHGWPHWPAAHALAARLAYRLGDLELAAEAVDAALALRPDEARWHILAARIALARRDFSAQEAHLQQAVQLEPENLSFRLTLAEAYLNQNHLDQARQLLEDALEKAPREAQVHYLLARVWHGLGRLASAQRHVAEALRLDPEHEAAALLRMALAAEQGQHKQALAWAQAWLENHPGHPEAVRHAAHALLALKRTDEALALVAALPHDHLAAQMLRAEIATAAGRGDEAVEIWRRLLEDDPENPRLWLGLAETLAAKRQVTEAAQAAHQALRLADDLPAKTRARLHRLLGHLAQETGHLDQALHHFSEAVQAAPREVEAWLGLGQVYVAREQYAEAQQAFSEAQRLAPHQSRPYYLAGLAFKASQDFEQAVQMFRKALNLEPDNQQIRRQLNATLAAHFFA